MLLLATTGSADGVCSVLASWSSAGLLRPFVHWVDDGSPEGAAERVDRGRREACSLAKALHGVPAGEVRVVGLAWPGDDGPEVPTGEAVERLNRILYSPVGQPLLPADTYRVAGMVIVISSVADLIDESLVEHNFRPIIMIAPEDRAAPDLVNNLGADAEALARHGAHAIASIAELWAIAKQRQPAVLDELEKTGGSLVQVVRPFSRTIDAGYVADHVATQVLRPVPNWPNPDQARFDDREFSDGLKVAVIDEYFRRHEQTLGLTKFEPMLLPQLPSLGLWAAIKAVFRYFIDGLRNVPASQLERMIAGAYDHIASRVETLAPGRSVKVLRWRNRDPARSPRQFIEEQLLARPLTVVDGAPGPAWSDLLGLTLGLADGMQLPKELDLEFLTMAGKRLVVLMPDALVPDPDRLPPNVGATRQDRTCDPLRWDPIAPLATPAMAATGGGIECGRGSSGSDDLLKDWYSHCSGSVLWRIGARIGEQIRQAGEESKPPPLDEWEKLDERAEEVKKTIREIRRSFVLWGVIANSAVAVLLGWLGVANSQQPWQKVLMLVGALLLWLLVLGWSWQRTAARIAAAEAAAAAEFLALLNRILLALMRAGDLTRMGRRYEEYLDWSEILSIFLHRPFVGRSVEALDLPDELDETTLPHAWTPGVGINTDQRFETICNRARAQLFYQGWLTLFQRQVAEALLIERHERFGGDRGEPGLVLHNPFGDTDSNEDSPRRWLLAGVRQGRHRDVGASPLTPDLLRVIGNLSIDMVAQRVVGRGDVPVHPLGPMGTWIDRPENLDRLAGPLRATIVRIDGKHSDGNVMGTGVIVDQSGIVVTNRHVVEGCSDLRVKFDDGTVVDAEIAQLGTTDIALLKIASAGGLQHPARLGSSSDLRTGTPVFTLGHPAALVGDPTLAWGLITATDRRTEQFGMPTRVLQASIAVTGGASGSPVFDLSGALVGLVFGGVDVGPGKLPADYITLVIPVDDIRDLLHQSPHTAPFPGAPLVGAVQLPGVGSTVSEFLEPLLKDLEPQPADLELPLRKTKASLPVGLWKAGTAEASRVRRVFLSSDGSDEPERVHDDPRVTDLSDGPSFLEPLRITLVRIDVSQPTPKDDLGHVTSEVAECDPSATSNDHDEV